MTLEWEGAVTSEPAPVPSAGSGCVRGAEVSPAHAAVEHEDLPRLRDLLDAGTDVEEVAGGLTLLQHAVDVEIDAHVERGAPLHVDTTAYLLARGADPLAPGGHGAGSALQAARLGGHWLAVALIESHLAAGGRAGAPGSAAQPSHRSNA
ncbi:hypothetical protein [Cellulomonas telluris]|uniref:hypothetical protein n=1 Tax=Cellulomonas telluris TaxID=2306636 RepID=UPI001CA3A81D|nr:hypothetical protein [Cellulomonas telluris]